MYVWIETSIELHRMKGGLSLMISRQLHDCDWLSQYWFLLLLFSFSFVSLMRCHFCLCLSHIDFALQFNNHCWYWGWMIFFDLRTLWRRQMNLDFSLYLNIKAPSITPKRLPKNSQNKHFWACLRIILDSLISWFIPL